MEDVGFVELLSNKSVEMRVIPPFLNSNQQQHIEESLEHRLLIITDHLHVFPLAI